MRGAFMLNAVTVRMPLIDCTAIAPAYSRRITPRGRASMRNSAIQFSLGACDDMAIVKCSAGHVMLVRVMVRVYLGDVFLALVGVLPQLLHLHPTRRHCTLDMHTTRTQHKIGLIPAGHSFYMPPRSRRYKSIKYTETTHR